MNKKKCIIFLLVLFLQKSALSQDYLTDKSFVKNKSENNLENFPFVFGLEFGFPVKFKKTYYENSYSGYMGIFLDKKKTSNILFEYGKVTPNAELKEEAGSLFSLGFSYKFLRVDKSILSAKLIFSLYINEAKKSGLAAPTVILSYDYKLTKILNLTGSIKYLIVNHADMDPYYHNPFISIGIVFFSP